MNSLSKMSWENAVAKAELLAAIRSFFDKLSVIEIETPLLSHGTITDVHLDAFSTEYKSSIDNDNTLYLQTSPEFAMKRLLCDGYQSIYQICKAFRHEDFGRYHNPEFTMLEWYRVEFDHFKLMEEVGDLLEYTLKCNKPEKISYQDAFNKYTQIDPLNTSLEDLKSYLSTNDKLEGWLLKEKNIDTLLQFIFAEFIEPKIGKNKPIFIFNFPASQASLAKISNEDPRVAERFECYFKGIELANGYHELTDAECHKQRFQQDNEIRNVQGNSVKPIDERFLEAINKGLPSCAGVALGVDRLLMIKLGVDSISQVIPFDIENA